MSVSILRLKLTLYTEFSIRSPLNTSPKFSDCKPAFDGLQNGNV